VITLGGRLLVVFTFCFGVAEGSRAVVALFFDVVILWKWRNSGAGAAELPLFF
jgi:hypothetical protein